MNDKTDFYGRDEGGGVKKKWLMIVISLFLLPLIFSLINLFERVEENDSQLPLTALDFDDFLTRITSSPKQNKADLESFEVIVTSTPTTTQVLALVNGTVIDGTGSGPLLGGTVILQGERILAIGRSNDLSLPPKANVEKIYR